jgi:hypothetical protein
MSYLVEKERVHIVSVTDNHTLAISDGGGLVEMNSATAKSVLVDTNANIPFPIGTQIIVVRKGTGTLNIGNAVGVTINSVSGNRYISTQYGAATLVKIASDEWYLFGDLTGV